MFPLIETVLHTFHTTPTDRLARLHRDKESAREDIERVLAGLARRNGIPQSEIERAMDDFGDALLEDATAEAEEDIAIELSPPDEEG
jgi:hypothetical protein